MGPWLDGVFSPEGLFGEVVVRFGQDVRDVIGYKVGMGIEGVKIIENRISRVPNMTLGELRAYAIWCEWMRGWRDSGFAMEDVFSASESLSRTVERRIGEIGEKEKSRRK